MLNISEHTVSFKNVIIDESDKQYDESRWRLLAWTLNLDPDFFTNLRNEPRTSKVRVVAITLRFLLLVGVSSDFGKL